MTSTTSQQQSQNQKIIVHRLIKEANSHGPYLWSGADIENALLWFPRPTTSAKHHHQQYEHADREKVAEEGTAGLVEGGKLSNETSLPSSSSVTAAKQQEEEEEGNEFLRLLLHSRGIWNPRPFKKKKKKKRSPITTNNNNTSATNNNNNSQILAHPDNMNAINKRKRKRKRIDSSNANEGGNSSNNTNRNNPKGGKKQPAATNTTEVMTSSPLQSVLMGYYQLLAHPKPVEVELSNESVLDERKNDGNNNNKDEEGNGIRATTKTAAVGAEATLEASTKLFNDLTTIISSRQHTLDIYQASISSLSSSLSSSQQQEEPPTRRRQKEKHKLVVVNMSIKIDQYMVHPTTCTRRVYASSIYDRLVHLARTTDTTTNTTNSNNNNDNAEQQQQVTRSSSSKEVQKFLQKLFGLATSSSSTAAAKGGGGEKNDEKIQEVILLVVLEPWRRLQVRQRQRQRQQLKRKEKETEENQNMQVTDCLDVQLPNNNQQQQREEEDSIQLFPLLTSQSVSPTTLAVSTKHKPSQEKDVTDNESSSPLITLLVNSILHTNSDTWWSQPSPLLCTVSHYHFPIARKYIYHWVNRALVTHENCYQDTTSSQELLFHHAVTRIQEFHRTSQRLGNLLDHFLDNMEEEIRMSPSRLMIMEDGEEEGDDEESEVFHTSLALRAIRRAL